MDSIVHRESRIIAYGKDNPYARVPEYATVAAVTREDLLNWHQQYVYPNNIIFGITGDFDPKAMQAKLEPGVRLVAERARRRSGRMSSSPSPSRECTSSARAT